MVVFVVKASVSKIVLDVLNHRLKGQNVLKGADSSQISSHAIYPTLVTKNVRDFSISCAVDPSAKEID